VEGDATPYLARLRVATTNRTINILSALSMVTTVPAPKPHFDRVLRRGVGRDHERGVEGNPAFLDRAHFLKGAARG
jgi:hypothetical protein